MKPRILAQIINYSFENLYQEACCLLFAMHRLLFIFDCLLFGRGLCLFRNYNNSNIINISPVLNLSVTQSQRVDVT